MGVFSHRNRGSPGGKIVRRDVYQGRSGGEFGKTPKREKRHREEARKRGTYLNDVWRDGCVVAVPVFDVALEVDVEVLEDEVELLVDVHDVEESVGLHASRSQSESRSPEGKRKARQK
jgi:hypothetical protein